MTEEHRPPGWSIDLKGDAFDLEDLSVLNHSDRHRITATDGGAYLWSDGFRTCNTAPEVQELATALVAMLNGAATVAISGFKPVSLGDVVRVSDDGSLATFATARITATARAHVSSDPDDRFLDQVMALVGQRPVDSVLELLSSRPHTWHHLYMVLDLIKADVGKRRLHKLGWVPDSELKRFTATANNFRVLGGDARHGVLAWTPPRSPMPLGDAVRLIRDLARAWLASRA